MTAIQIVREYAAKGSHDLEVRATKLQPRRYTAVCKGCYWRGTPDSLAADADREAIQHARDTLPTGVMPSAAATASEGEPAEVLMVDVEEPEPERPAPIGELPEEFRKLIPKKERFTSYAPRALDGTTDYEVLKKAGLRGDAILIQGDTGTGKNHMAEALAADLEVPLICLSMNADVQTEDLIGATIAVPTDAGMRFEWVDGWFTAFMRLAQANHRCVFVCDEVNAATHGPTFRLHQSLDERRTLVLPEKGRELPIIDEFHNLIFIGTQNPDYRGTKPLNEALKRRFKTKIAVDYDYNVERRLLLAKKMSAWKIERLLKFASAVRKSYHDIVVSQPLGTADLLNYADNEKLFGEKVARHILMNNYDAGEEQQAVQEAITLHLDNARITGA